MYKFHAEERKLLGKSASRRLRSNLLLPASVYLRESGKTLQVVLKHKDFLYIQQGDFEVNKPIELEVQSEQRKNLKVIFREIQRHPYKNLILHIDFQEVA